MTDNCREIKKVARFNGTLVFTDVGGRQVKWYSPSNKKVETLAGDGSEGAQDGTEKSFVQVHGICSVLDTLFTTDAAAETNNLKEDSTTNGPQGTRRHKPLWSFY